MAGAGDQILRDLEAFGFEWDGGVVYQSERFDQYRHYLEQLIDQGDCYACQCSRRMLREQGVQSGALGLIYPGLCRTRGLAPENHSLRLLTEAGQRVGFRDHVYGEFALDLPECVGDFVLRRRDNIYAYHLAVVVDDELQGIDQVVRGADLLENTCLHIYLQQRLGFRMPSYLHLPLVNNADGVKLSKQTGASPLDHRNPSRQLLAALSHLGQQPPRDLEDAGPRTILQWSRDHWNAAAITPRRSPIAETFD